MVWCGFDESMRSGIVTFATGVARAIFDKAKLRNVTVAAQVDREKIELRILEELAEKRLATNIGDHSNDDSLRLKAFVGMVSVARYLIERKPLHELRPNEEPNFYADAHSLGTLIKEFEEAYERQPHAKTHEEKVIAALDETFDSRSIGLQNAAVS